MKTLLNNRIVGIIIGIMVLITLILAELLWPATSHAQGNDCTILSAGFTIGNTDSVLAFIGICLMFGSFARYLWVQIVFDHWNAKLSSYIEYYRKTETMSSDYMRWLLKQFHQPRLIDFWNLSKWTEKDFFYDPFLIMDLNSHFESKDIES